MLDSAMTRNVHIVGNFPIRDVKATFVLQDETLRGRLHRYAACSTFSAFTPDCEPDFAPAASAYAIFNSLREARKLPDDARMQLSLAPAVHYAPNVADGSGPPGFLTSGNADQLNERLIRHFERLVAVVPSSDLAVQVEVPLADFREASAKHSSGHQAEMQRSLVRAALQILDAIPADGQRLVHFDCRDGARYKMGPGDMITMIEISRSLIRASRRTLTLIHFPVPLAHEDDSFFKGLDALELPPSTKLCLGLIHLSDGLDGALKRMAFATMHVSDFDVAARGGFGARSPDQIREFMNLHARVADTESNGNAKEVHR